MKAASWLGTKQVDYKIVFHFACTVLVHLSDFKNSNYFPCDYIAQKNLTSTISLKIRNLFYANSHRTFLLPVYDICTLMVTTVSMSISSFYKTRERIVFLVPLDMCVSQEICRNGPCLGQSSVWHSSSCFKLQHFLSSPISRNIL